MKLPPPHLLFATITVVTMYSSPPPPPPPPPPPRHLLLLVIIPIGIADLSTIYYSYSLLSISVPIYLMNIQSGHYLFCFLLIRFQFESLALTSRCLPHDEEQLLAHDQQKDIPISIL